MRNRNLSVFILVLLGSSSGSGRAQEKPIEPGQREVGRAMLDDVKSDVMNNYYDPKFGGVDIQARFKEADERLKKATSLNQTLGIIAWAVDGLHDSHTHFIPPPRPYRLDYGWNMEMIGEQCYVTAVKPGSDAEKKGLKPGDLVESVNGVAPTRDTLWSMNYLFKILRPLPGLQVLVRGPDGQERTLGITAEVRQGKRIINIHTQDFWDEIREAETEYAMLRRRSYEIGQDIIIWKLPALLLNEKGVDAMVGKSKDFKSVILDLRGNPGGFQDAMVRMVSNFFDHDVKVGDSKSRKETRPLTAKARRGKAYAGKLFVLIDSESASASEIFARVVQLEKRGTLVGDNSSGSVMEAVVYPHQLGIDRAIYYADEVSRADLIMADGKSLEHFGVVPDEKVLPSAADLASQRDPVLARAVSLAGGSLSPEEAGKLFPVEWRKN